MRYLIVGIMAGVVALLVFWPMQHFWLNWLTPEDRKTKAMLVGFVGGIACVLGGQLGQYLALISSSSRSK